MTRAADRSGVDWSKVPPPPHGVTVQSFCKKLVAPSANDQLPRLNALVIVEGFNDCWAVQRAVRAPVFVLGGGYAVAEAMKPELQYLAKLAVSGHVPRQLVVFTDPDWQGRMFRTYLDDVLPAPADKASPKGEHEQRSSSAQTGAAEAKGRTGAASGGVVVRHAFLRVELGTSNEDDRYHEAGNVGVEHAAPDTIRTCLKRARRRFGTERREFTLEELRSHGLAGSWDSKQQAAGSAPRRQHFCRALGIDEVGTGKGLLNLLNRFFTREEYTEALAIATERVQRRERS